MPCRYTQIWFTLRCMFPKYSDWNLTYTRRGLVKLYLQRGLRVLALLVLLVGALKARQKGIGTAGLRAGALRLIRLAAANGRELLRNVRV